MQIDGATKITGLMGEPVMYSLSPAMHNAAFSALNLPYVYIPFHVTKDDVPTAIAAIRALGIIGLNVTVPHKEVVIPFLDRLDVTAQRCGAVNTIINQNGVLTGYNTDGTGFIDSLLEAGFNPAHKKAVILGAGGAARAVATALQDNGIAELTILNRTLAKAEELALLLRGKTKVVTLPLTPGEQPDLMGSNLIVNTLSVPFKQDGEWLLNLASAQGALFYDLRYGKMPSDFLVSAHQLKSPGQDGLGMLLHQGARAFQLFTGIDAPVAVMRTVLRNLP